MTGASRLDVALVERGLVRSRSRGGAAVRAGRVRVDGVVVVRPAHPVAPGAVVELEAVDGLELVSRAGGKLAGALDALARVATTGPPAPDPDGRDCLDLGASTGGFTQVLLDRGARRVVAVDVGHDQIVPELRADPRVDVREGLNARDLTAADLPVAPTLVVADLSFISLRLVLPALVPAAPAAELLLMVKPQFEVGRELLGRGGVVRDPEHHVRAVLDVVACAAEHGARLRAVVASSVPGPSGNREFFCWFGPADGAPDTTDGAEPAVRAAVADSSGTAAQVVAPAPRTTGG